MRGPRAASRRSGSIVWLAPSGSTPTGTAPIEATASQVVADPLAGTSTSSPRSTPSARRPRASASKPLPTPAQWAAPLWAANSASNASSCSPIRKRPLRITAR